MSQWFDRLAALSPGLTEPPASLPDALGLLELDVATSTLTAAVETVASGACAATVLVALAVPAPLRIAVLALGATVAAGVWWVGVHGPVALAAARRRRAIGTAPWLVCLAAMRLQVAPTAESAAVFAARDDRLLTRRLAVHVRRARGTGRTGFDGFRAEWGDRFPPLDRAIAALQTAATAPEADREAGIERALDTVLGGVRHRAADDAAALQGPVTALYAFGVLLPLALVAALPAAAVAGLPVTVPALVVGYDLLLPAGLGVASLALLSRRPVTFPVVSIPRSHPAIPQRRWPPVVAGLVGGTLAGVTAHALVAPWAGPIGVVGAGIGTALVTRFRHERRVRAHVTEIERSLPALLTRVGRAVTDGQPVESALGSVGENLSNTGTAPISGAVERMDRLGVGVEDALFGEYGTLATVPSPRAEGAARLLATAAREGRPAGTALVAAGDHLTALRRVERETHRTLGRLTRTMGNTAAVFGPLVGGVTVALGGRMHGSELGQGVPVDALGPVVGVYVLVLAAVLTALATGLERGFDRALVGYRIGLALVAATATYLVAVHAARLVT